MEGMRLPARLLVAWSFLFLAGARADEPVTEATHPAPKLPARLWTEGHSGGISPTAPFSLQSFVKLSRTLGPAVVNISTLQGGGEDGTGPHAKGQGTGFVIEKSGIILTNNHVVERAEEIRVRLSDEREFPAHLLGRDVLTDIAVLKIDVASDLAVCPLGDSDKLQIGEWVMAIGNPFGLDHTVTAGIVSAKGRHDVRPGGSTAGFYDFIQTDASINEGNSGGPLINLHGEVIGINAAINAKAHGIAFAIPINMAKAIVPRLAAQGWAPRSWMGVFPQSVTPGLKRAFGLDSTTGALISEVFPNTPASQVGIVAGDVVTEFDGRPIRHADDLTWLSSIGGAGRTVPISVVHEGKVRRVSITLAPLPSDTGPAPASAKREHESPFGMTVSEITLGIARELRQPDLHGAVVTSVEPESPASQAGVERGDVILRVGEVAVGNLDDYWKAVRAVPHGGMIKLLAQRNENFDAGIPLKARKIWLAFPKR
jgi:serine protease Do